MDSHELSAKSNKYPELDFPSRNEMFLYRKDPLLNCL